MLEFSPSTDLCDSLGTHFRRAFYEYRIACIEIDALKDHVLPEYQNEITSCIACPRGKDEGDIYSAVDVMFRLARRKKAGKHNVASNHVRYFCNEPAAIRQYLQDHNADQEIGEKPQPTKIKIVN